MAGMCIVPVKVQPPVESVVAAAAEHLLRAMLELFLAIEPQ
jgi:hypothetical protein